MFASLDHMFVGGMGHAGGATTDDVRRFVSGDVTVDLIGVDDRGHIDALFQADLLARAVEAARVEVVTSALVSSAWNADGHRTPAAWVRATVGVGPRESLDLTRRADLSARFPRYLDALRHGSLSVAQYDVIARAFTNVRARWILGEMVDVLVGEAQRLAFADFVHVVAVIIDLADDDGPEPDDRDETRSVTLRQRTDGWWELKGRLTPDAGVVLDEILSRFLDAETDIDRAAADAAGTPGEYARSVSQRRADALMAMATQAVTTPPGKPAEPLVRLVVDLDTANAILAKHLTGGDPFEQHPLFHHGINSDGDGDPPLTPGRAFSACRTMNGDTIPTRVMLDAMIRSRIQVLIIDALGNPFAMGTAAAPFSTRLRDAQLTLATHCCCDGCLTANRHLQADHVQPRSQGGTNAPTNIAPPCGTHNRWRYNHGYHLVRDTNGRWTMIRPDGTAVRPTPPAWPPAS